MADFHLLRPWWLLTLIPIVVLAVIAWRNGAQQTGWSRLLPAHLKPLLLPESAGRAARWPLLFVNAALAVTALALAGPTWQRLPQPVFQLQAGSVVIMDMSLSVYSTDLAPNRLTQMRYKATDLVRDKLDGEIGLIAYAGDAFTISPLTGDGGNLTNLIRALSPDIMPTPGSYPIRALNLADQLLQDAGYPQGDIYWFTDGIDSRDQQDISDFLNRTQHRLSVLAVGTAEGAPITLPDGRLLRDASNNVVIPQLQPGALQTLAARSGGRFSEIRSDQQDLEYLSNQPPLQRDGEASAMQAGDQWQDQGPWLIPIIMLLLLPLARRGALPLFVCFVFSSSFWLPPAQAGEREPLSWQDKLWQTPYQQTDQALRAGNNERAAQIAEDAWQRGTANYRAGNYDQALVDFSQLDSAEGFYNQGNTLMQMERYDEAKNAYSAALKGRPNWPQAQDNMNLAEQLAKQQQQQSENNQQGDAQNNNSQNQQGEQGEQQSGEQQQSDPGQNDQQPGQDERQQEQEQEKEQESTEQSAESEQQQTAPEGEQEKPLQSEFGEASEEELQQQMQQWLNRIEDDPAVLLRNKMRYEAQQRRRQSPPPGVEKQW